MENSKCEQIGNVERLSHLHLVPHLAEARTLFWQEGWSAQCKPAKPKHLSEPRGEIWTSLWLPWDMVNPNIMSHRRGTYGRNGNFRSLREPNVTNWQRYLWCTLTRWLLFDTLNIWIRQFCGRNGHIKLNFGPLCCKDVSWWELLSQHSKFRSCCLPEFRSARRVLIQIGGTLESCRHLYTSAIRQTLSRDNRPKEKETFYHLLLTDVLNIGDHVM